MAPAVAPAWFSCDARVHRRIPELLLISDSQRLETGHFFKVVEAALKGGVDMVMVREKQMDSARLLGFSARLRDLTRRAGCRLIIHTQADVARAVGADGVHVAAADIAELPAIRNWIAGESMTLSASCHNLGEINKSRMAGADFTLLSPVFSTSSHPGSSCLGVNTFRSMAALSMLPVIALGGINQANRDQLDGYGVAVISAILGAINPEEVATGLLSGSSQA